MEAVALCCYRNVNHSLSVSCACSASTVFWTLWNVRSAQLECPPLWRRNGTEYDSCTSAKHLLRRWGSFDQVARLVIEHRPFLATSLATPVRATPCCLARGQTFLLNVPCSDISLITCKKPSSAFHTARQHAPQILPSKVAPVPASAHTRPYALTPSRHFWPTSICRFSTSTSEANSLTDSVTMPPRAL